MAESPSFADYASSYRRHVGNLVRSSDEAMSLAVGGNYDSFGFLMREILVGAGLRDSDYLIDVGCGSGRLAHVLTIERYLGTDIVPELLAHARARCPNPAWRFELVNDMAIPEAAGAADMVCFFSVLTHLLHEDSYRYLQEAHRVLKAGGAVVFSFLEFKIPSHWAVFAGMITHREGGKVHNQFISRDAIASWCAHLGFSIESTYDGDTPHIPLRQPLTLEDGRVVEGMACLGQSVCILRKKP
ncbi:MAG: methyltransferase domain-containing protein [Bryobacteraceae bacterium]|jgi:SAM-dependent methyltransferase